MQVSRSVGKLSAEDVLEESDRPAHDRRALNGEVRARPSTGRTQLAERFDGFAEQGAKLGPGLHREVAFFLRPE